MIQARAVAELLGLLDGGHVDEAARRISSSGCVSWRRRPTVGLVGSSIPSSQIRGWMT
jgi:hypothetical protein